MIAYIKMVVLDMYAWVHYTCTCIIIQTAPRQRFLIRAHWAKPQSSEKRRYRQTVVERTCTNTVKPHQNPLSMCTVESVSPHFGHLLHFWQSAVYSVAVVHLHLHQPARVRHLCTGQGFPSLPTNTGKLYISNCLEQVLWKTAVKSTTRTRGY